MSRRISVNKARCRRCDTVIESKHRHDLKECSCGDVFVDGGKTYLRRGFPSNKRPEDCFEELSEYHEEEENES